MPALSPTMTEGNLARWLKKEGDTVKAGDVLAEIETDKATMEFEAVDEGTLGKILVPEGAQGVKVNQPIALMLEEGEDPATLEQRAAPPPSRAPPPPQPPAAPTPAAAPRAARRERRPSAGAAPRRRAARGNGARAHGDGRVFASPLARRMAEQAGLDLAAIRGTGPQGRIVKADVDAALAQRRRGAAPGRRAPPARRGAGAPPRRRSWRWPATRPTPRCRTARCAGSSPGG